MGDNILLAILMFVYSVMSGISNLGMRTIDPCYKVYMDAKGSQFEIKNNRVCMEYSSDGMMAKRKTLEGADAETFEQFDYNYYIDKNSVFYYDEIIDGVNSDFFEKIGNGYYKDDKNIIYANDIINETEYTSFDFIKGHYDYGKDKNSVFKGSQKISVFPTSFVFLNDFIAKDKKFVYASGITIHGADPDTFEQVGNTSYYKDKNHVYYLSHILKGSDPDTFEQTSFKKGSYLNPMCGKDKNHIYCGDEIEK